MQRKFTTVNIPGNTYSEVDLDKENVWFINKRSQLVNFMLRDNKTPVWHDNYLGINTIGKEGCHNFVWMTYEYETVKDQCQCIQDKNLSNRPNWVYFDKCSDSSDCYVLTTQRDLLLDDNRCTCQPSVDHDINRFQLTDELQFSQYQIPLMRCILSLHSDSQIDLPCQFLGRKIILVNNRGVAQYFNTFYNLQLQSLNLCMCYL